MRIRVAAGLLLAIGLAGCGLQVHAPDLFQVTRTGAGGQKLTLLVNDSGTVSCDGRKPKMLSDPLLLQARDLATSLNEDVGNQLKFTGSPRSVYSYSVNVQTGTMSFPDTAASTRKELARLELFLVQAAADPCGISS